MGSRTRARKAVFRFSLQTKGHLPCCRLRRKLVTTSSWTTCRFYHACCLAPQALHVMWWSCDDTIHTKSAFAKSLLNPGYWVPRWSECRNRLSAARAVSPPNLSQRYSAAVRRTERRRLLPFTSLFPFMMVLKHHDWSNLQRPSSIEDWKIGRCRKFGILCTPDTVVLSIVAFRCLKFELPDTCIIVMNSLGSRLCFMTVVYKKRRVSLHTLAPRLLFRLTTPHVGAQLPPTMPTYSAVRRKRRPRT